MTMCNYNCRSRCIITALIASAVLGVVAAFLQITGMITVTPAFLWVALGIAVGYQTILIVANALARGRDRGEDCCGILQGLLAGILGVILVSVILLAVGIVATSVISAILVGILVFFLSLIFTGSACYVKCLADCTNTVA